MTPTSSISSRVPKPTTAACAQRAPAVKAAFARDLLNLTLAHPRLNRYQKIGKDVAEWHAGRERLLVCGANTWKFAASTA